MGFGTLSKEWLTGFYDVLHVYTFGTDNSFGNLEIFILGRGYLKFTGLLDWKLVFLGWNHLEKCWLIWLFKLLVLLSILLTKIIKVWKYLILELLTRRWSIRLLLIRLIQWVELLELLVILYSWLISLLFILIYIRLLKCCLFLSLRVIVWSSYFLFFFW